MQTNTRKLYDALDSEFTRKNALSKGKHLGISYGSIDMILAKLVFHEAIERTALGRYKKK
jgi:hypothetical protein